MGRLGILVTSCHGLRGGLGIVKEAHVIAGHFIDGKRLADLRPKIS